MVPAIGSTERNSKRVPIPREAVHAPMGSVLRPAQAMYTVEPKPGTQTAVELTVAGSGDACGWEACLIVTKEIYKPFLDNCILFDHLDQKKALFLDHQTDILLHAYQRYQILFSFIRLHTNHVYEQCLQRV